MQWNHEPRVSSLIRECTWDVELTSNNFNPYVTRYSKNSSSSNEIGDSRYWQQPQHDPKGQYSVRDGYRLQQGLFEPSEHQSELLHEKWWTFLWGLLIPPKARVFWWKVSHDCIATNLNLLYHHFPVNGISVICVHFL